MPPSASANSTTCSTPPARPDLCRWLGRAGTTGCRCRRRSGRRGRRRRGRPTSSHTDAACRRDAGRRAAARRCDRCGEIVVGPCGHQMLPTTHTDALRVFLRGLPAGTLGRRRTLGSGVGGVGLGLCGSASPRDVDGCLVTATAGVGEPRFRRSSADFAASTSASARAIAFVAARCSRRASSRAATRRRRSAAGTPTVSSGGGLAGGGPPVAAASPAGRPGAWRVATRRTGRPQRRRRSRAQQPATARPRCRSRRSLTGGPWLATGRLPPDVLEGLPAEPNQLGAAVAQLTRAARTSGPPRPSITAASASRTDAAAAANADTVSACSRATAFSAQSSHPGRRAAASAVASSRRFSRRSDLTSSLRAATNSLGGVANSSRNTVSSNGPPTVPRCGGYPGSRRGTRPGRSAEGCRRRARP